MKKTFVLSAALLASVFLAGQVHAGKYTNTAGAELVMADGAAGAGGGTNATLKVAASPGVAFTVNTVKNAFAIQSWNTNVTGDNKRVEYVIYSQYAGYYQKPVATATATTVFTDLTIENLETTDPFSGWTAMGGTKSN